MSFFHIKICLIQTDEKLKKSCLLGSMKYVSSDKFTEENDLTEVIDCIYWKCFELMTLHKNLKILLGRAWFFAKTFLT